MKVSIEWKFVPGGVCAFGDDGRLRRVKDLWWTITPVTHGQAGQSESDSNASLPLTNVSYYEASELALTFNARLPTSIEWEWMAGGVESRLYPWGNAAWTSHKANIESTQIGNVTPVGIFLEGATPEGLLDVAGNVWEWTSSLTPGNGAVIRGGSYNSLPLYVRTKFLNIAPRELASHGIGLRLVRTNS